MATKTISIDIEAYRRLKTSKSDAESFSQAIKRLIPAKPDLDAWFRLMDENPISDQGAAAVEKVVKQRRASVNRKSKG
jgi:predicted CopG family antitoxin